MITKTKSAVIVSASLLCLGATVNSASAEASHPQEVSARALGYEISQESSQNQIAWRIEVDSSGQSTVLTGPGVSTKPLDKSTVRYAQEIPQASVTFAAASGGWVCSYHTKEKTVLNGNYLDSYIGNYCTGRPGTQQLQWWFDHDNWYGWSMYSNEKHETSWTPAQALGTPVSARCQKGKGIYNYWAVMKAQYKFSGPVVGVNVAHTEMGRYNCGTSEF